MITRFLIALVAAVCALQVSRLPAQSEGPDNFIPNQPQKVGASPGNSDSQAVKYSLILPSEKSSEAVKEEERNPFGKGDDDMHDLSGKGSNEETKIQEQLSKLRATGLSPGPTGLRVLFGDMWLSKDDIMPSVVKDQTLALRVNEISREAIQLVWMEKKFTGLPPRMLVLPVDLRATVHRVPHGEIPEKPEAKRESKAIKRATTVELPAAVVASGDVAEARKIAKLSLAPGSSIAPEPAGAKGPVAAASPAKNGPAAATSTSTSTDSPVAGPPAPSPATGNSTLATQGDAPRPATAPPVPAATEPAAWKRAMGLMETLVKLSEADK